MSKQINIRRSDDNVAVVVIDTPDKKVNTLTTALGDELGQVLEELENDPSCAAVVLMGKPDGFVAGADIDMLAACQSADEATQLARDGQRMMARLAEMKIPVIAAMHGPCLGGGLELALSCHGRVCSDHDKTVLGLPEVQLGLIPGSGGTQRLPRLVGIQDALDMILTGKNIRPKKAVKIGLVDELVPVTALELAASKLALRLAKQRKQGRAKAMGQELKKLTDSREVTDLLLGRNPLGRRVVFNKSREMVQAKTRSNYPAPFAALRAIEAGLSDGVDKGYAVEAEEFGKLVVSPVSRRLVEIFHATQALKKDSGVDSDVEPAKVDRLALLGGGFMGSGIAYIAAGKGVQVRIKERDPSAGAQALGTVWGLLGEKLKRRFIRKPEAQRIMSRVTASDDLSGWAKSDLVVEAVFEDLELKQKLLREVEAVTQPYCVIASNTSSIPITQIAAAAKRKGQVLGMHFFSPVHKMPLLEIIVTEATEDRATATAVAFGKRLGKQVIVVRDGVGFYTSRILAPYMTEATRILAEGGDIKAIDSALKDFGFPVGPITLIDEVGIDVGAKVTKIMHEAFGERMAPVTALQSVIDDGRHGRKNGRGFYAYEDGKKAGVDESVYALLPGGSKRRHFDVEEIQQRVALMMVNEAMHCMGDGVLRSARDGDIGAIFGLGFPPFLGGPFRYADLRGAARVLDDLQKLEERYGARFTPAKALVEAAKNKHSFHG